MHPFLFLLATFSCCYASEELPLSPPPSHASPCVVIEVEKLQPSSTPEIHSIPLQIDTIDDIKESTCSINCMRGTRSFWTVSTGFFSFLGGIGTPTKSALVALSTLGEYSPTVKKWLGITTTLVSSGTFAFNKLADIGHKRAINIQKELKEVEEKIQKILEKYEMDHESMPLNLKSSSSHKISPLDKKVLEDLHHRYENLTELSAIEKKYFSVSSCCLNTTYSSAQVIDSLLNIANFVMIPLATVPAWDPTTATALGIVSIVLEGGTIFFKQLARQSLETSQATIQLRKELEEADV